MPMEGSRVEASVQVAQVEGERAPKKENYYILRRKASGGSRHEPAHGGRQYDKQSHSGTGRSPAVKRAGRGARNWGDEVDAQLEGALDAQKEKETAAFEEWKYYYV